MFKGGYKQNKKEEEKEQGEENKIASIQQPVDTTIKENIESLVASVIEEAQAKIENSQNSEENKLLSIKDVNCDKIIDYEKELINVPDPVVDLLLNTNNNTEDYSSDSNNNNNNKPYNLYRVVLEQTKLETWTNNEEEIISQKMDSTNYNDDLNDVKFFDDQNYSFSITSQEPSGANFSSYLNRENSLNLNKNLNISTQDNWSSLDNNDLNQIENEFNINEENKINILLSTSLPLTQNELKKSSNRKSKLNDQEDDEEELVKLELNNKIEEKLVLNSSISPSSLSIESSTSTSSSSKKQNLPKSPVIDLENQLKFYDRIQEKFLNDLDKTSSLSSGTGGLGGSTASGVDTSSIKNDDFMIATTTTNIQLDEQNLMSSKLRRHSTSSEQKYFDSKRSSPYLSNENDSKSNDKMIESDSGTSDMADINLQINIDSNNNKKNENIIEDSSCNLTNNVVPKIVIEENNHNKSIKVDKEQDEVNQFSNSKMTESFNSEIVVDSSNTNELDSQTNNHNDISPYSSLLRKTFFSNDSSSTSSFAGTSSNDETKNENTCEFLTTNHVKNNEKNGDQEKRINPIDILSLKEVGEDEDSSSVSNYNNLSTISNIDDFKKTINTSSVNQFEPTKSNHDDSVIIINKSILLKKHENKNYEEEPATSLLSNNLDELSTITSSFANIKLSMSPLKFKSSVSPLKLRNFKLGETENCNKSSNHSTALSSTSDDDDEFFLAISSTKLETGSCPEFYWYPIIPFNVITNSGHDFESKLLRRRNSSREQFSKLKLIRKVKSLNDLRSLNQKISSKSYDNITHNNYVQMVNSMINGAISEAADPEYVEYVKRHIQGLFENFTPVLMKSKSNEEIVINSPSREQIIDIKNFAMQMPKSLSFDYQLIEENKLELKDDPMDFNKFGLGISNDEAETANKDESINSDNTSSKSMIDHENQTVIENANNNDNNNSNDSFFISEEVKDILVDLIDNKLIIEDYNLSNDTVDESILNETLLNNKNKESESIRELAVTTPVGSESSVASTVINLLEENIKIDEIQSNEEVEEEDEHILTLTNQQNISSSLPSPSESPSPKLLFSSLNPTEEESNLNNSQTIDLKIDLNNHENISLLSKISPIQNDSNILDTIIIQEPVLSNNDNESVVIDEFELHYREDLGISNINEQLNESEDDESCENDQEKVKVDDLRHRSSSIAEKNSEENDDQIEIINDLNDNNDISTESASTFSKSPPSEKCDINNEIIEDNIILNQSKLKLGDMSEDKNKSNENLIEEVLLVKRLEEEEKKIVDSESVINLEQKQIVEEAQSDLKRSDSTTSSSTTTSNDWLDVQKAINEYQKLNFDEDFSEGSSNSKTNNEKLNALDSNSQLIAESKESKSNLEQKSEVLSLEFDSIIFELQSASLGKNDESKSTNIKTNIVTNSGKEDSKDPNNFDNNRNRDDKVNKDEQEDKNRNEKNNNILADEKNQNNDSLNDDIIIDCKVNYFVKTENDEMNSSISDSLSSDDEEKKQKSDYDNLNDNKKDFEINENNSHNDNNFNNDSSLSLADVDNHDLNNLNNNTDNNNNETLPSLKSNDFVMEEEQEEDPEAEYNFVEDFTDLSKELDDHWIQEDELWFSSQNNNLSSSQIPVKLSITTSMSTFNMIQSIHQPRVLERIEEERSSMCSERTGEDISTCSTAKIKECETDVDDDEINELEAKKEENKENEFIDEKLLENVEQFKIVLEYKYKKEGLDDSENKEDEDDQKSICSEKMRTKECNMNSLLGDISTQINEVVIKCEEEQKGQEKDAELKSSILITDNHTKNDLNVLVSYDKIQELSSDDSQQKLNQTQGHLELKLEIEENKNELTEKDATELIISSQPFNNQINEVQQTTVRQTEASTENDASDLSNSVSETLLVSEDIKKEDNSSSSSTAENENDLVVQVEHIEVIKEEKQTAIQSLEVNDMLTSSTIFQSNEGNEKEEPMELSIKTTYHTNESDLKQDEEDDDEEIIEELIFNNNPTSNMIMSPFNMQKGESEIDLTKLKLNLSQSFGEDESEGSNKLKEVLSDIEKEIEDNKLVNKIEKVSPISSESLVEREDQEVAEIIKQEENPTPRVVEEIKLIDRPLNLILEFINDTNKIQELEFNEKIEENSLDLEIDLKLNNKIPESTSWPLINNNSQYNLNPEDKDHKDSVMKSSITSDRLKEAEPIYITGLPINTAKLTQSIGTSYDEDFFSSSKLSIKTDSNIQVNPIDLPGKVMVDTQTQMTPPVSPVAKSTKFITTTIINKVEKVSVATETDEIDLDNLISNEEKSLMKKLIEKENSLRSQSIATQTPIEEPPKEATKKGPEINKEENFDFEPPKLKYEDLDIDQDGGDEQCLKLLSDMKKMDDQIKKELSELNTTNNSDSNKNKENDFSTSVSNTTRQNIKIQNISVDEYLKKKKEDEKDANNVRLPIKLEIKTLTTKISEPEKQEEVEVEEKQIEINVQSPAKINNEQQLPTSAILADRLKQKNMDNKNEYYSVTKISSSRTIVNTNNDINNKPTIKENLNLINNSKINQSDNSLVRSNSNNNFIDLLSLNLDRSKTWVEMTEAKLNYMIGETDAALKSMCYDSSDEDHHNNESKSNKNKIPITKSPSVYEKHSRSLLENKLNTSSSSKLQQIRPITNNKYESEEINLEEMTKLYLENYKKQLEESRRELNSKMSLLEKEKEKLSKIKDIRKRELYMRRKMAVEAFKLERDRELNAPTICKIDDYMSSSKTNLNLNNSNYDIEYDYDYIPVSSRSHANDYSSNNNNSFTSSSLLMTKKNSKENLMPSQTREKLAKLRRDFLLNSTCDLNDSSYNDFSTDSVTNTSKANYNNNLIVEPSYLKSNLRNDSSKTYQLTKTTLSSSKYSTKNDQNKASISSTNKTLTLSSSPVNSIPIRNKSLSSTPRNNVISDNISPNKYTTYDNSENLNIIKSSDSRLLMPAIKLDDNNMNSSKTLNLSGNSPQQSKNNNNDTPRSIIDESRLLLREYEQLRSDSVSEIQRAHDSLNASLVWLENQKQNRMRSLLSSENKSSSIYDSGILSRSTSKSYTSSSTTTTTTISSTNKLSNHGGSATPSDYKAYNTNISSRSSTTNQQQQQPTSLKIKRDDLSPIIARYSNQRGESCDSSNKSGGLLLSINTSSLYASSSTPNYISTYQSSASSRKEVQLPIYSPLFETNARNSTPRI